MRFSLPGTSYICRGAQGETCMGEGDAGEGVAEHQQSFNQEEALRHACAVRREQGPHEGVIRRN